MENISVVCALISAVATVVVAGVETTNRNHNKREQHRRERRERETYLAMELQSATLDLSFVTSLAVTGGHTNGNVKEAQSKAKLAQEAYQKFLKQETAHTVAKV